jgi:hypothetical protein
VEDGDEVGVAAPEGSVARQDRLATRKTVSRK